MDCNGQKIYRPYVSGSWRTQGGLTWWVDECVIEPRIVSDSGKQMAWSAPNILCAVEGFWCASKEDCDREVVRMLRAKAQEILDQAAALENKTADH